MFWKNGRFCVKLGGWRACAMRIQVFGASVVRTYFGIVNTVEISGIQYLYQFYR